MPRSDAWQWCAMEAASVLPSPIAPNTFSSIAVRRAAVRWKDISVSKTISGLGCSVCGAVAMGAVYNGVLALYTESHYAAALSCALRVAPGAARLGTGQSRVL